MIKYVTGFMFSCDKSHVALIKKINPQWQRGKLNGIGGKIEKNESPEVAISREFKEEAGVETSPSDWCYFLKLTDEFNFEVNMLYCFSNSVFSVSSIEDEEVGVFNIKELPENIISNLNWLIPFALDENIQHRKVLNVFSRIKPINK